MEQTDADDFIFWFVCDKEGLPITSPFKWRSDAEFWRSNMVAKELKKQAIVKQYELMEV